MQVIDFDKAFKIGEISGRILNFDILQNPSEITTFWANSNTWGKCEFIEQPNGSYKPKVIVNTHGLSPGSFQDILTILDEDHQECFLVKFSVLPLEINLVTPPKSVGDNVPPKLVASPDKVDLGKIDIGEVVACKIIVSNIGGPVWEDVKAEWDTSKSFYPSLKEFRVTNWGTGQDFPMEICVTFDTNKAETNKPFQYQLQVITGSKAVLLRIPLTYSLLPYVSPSLTFSTPRIYCEMSQNHQTQIDIAVLKKGSKLTKLEYVWEHQYSWHSQLVMVPEGLNDFPKVMCVRLNTGDRRPGDYRDKITISVDKNSYTIPVVMRVLPPTDDSVS